MSNPKKRLAGWVAIFGALAFLGIALALHFLQHDYRPRDQPISELALGPHGWAMLPAFTSLGISILAVQYGMRYFETPVAFRALLIVAAVGILLAGVFPLDKSAELHVGAIVLAFALILLVICLLPLRARQLQSRAFTVISWTLAATAIASAYMVVTLGLPGGIGQRIAAASVLVWVCLLGSKLVAR